MKKSDLKDGMVVEQRNGKRYLVIGNREYDETCHNEIEQYSEDLNSWIEDGTHYTEYGVIKIYIPTDTAYGFNDILDKKNLNLIWERREYPKLTRYEKEVLERAINKYRYIARDQNKRVWVFSCKPIRNVSTWNDPGNEKEIIVYRNDFGFIKWSDEEPWNIQELLENCEVEE